MEWGKYLKDSEKQTAEKTVDALLAAFPFLTASDGEEITVKHSTDKAAILAALGTTEEDFLFLYVYRVEPDSKPRRIGWVRFVWGNEDWVAICDHTTNLEAVLQPVFEWMDEQSAAAEWNLMHPRKEG